MGPNEAKLSGAQRGPCSGVLVVKPVPGQPLPIRRCGPMSISADGEASFLAVVLLLFHPKTAQENSRAEEGRLAAKDACSPPGAVRDCPKLACLA